MSRHLISIEHCVRRRYTLRAVSLTEELPDTYSHAIETLTLIPFTDRMPEVMIDEASVIGKRSLGRRPKPGAIARLFEENTGHQKPG